MVPKESVELAPSNSVTSNPAFIRRSTRALERITNNELFTYSKRSLLPDIPEHLVGEEESLLHFLALMWGIHMGRLLLRDENEERYPNIFSQLDILGLSGKAGMTVCMQMQETGDFENLDPLKVFISPAFRVGGMDLLTENEKK